jgi:hypothetical protein
MATSNLSGLFGNTNRSPRDYRQAYVNLMREQDASRGSQSTSQSAISLAGDMGTSLGAGLGQLFGGQTSEQVRDAQINDALTQVNAVEFDNESNRMLELGKQLRSRGLENEAQQAFDQANKLKVQGYQMGAMERDENYRIDFAALGANPTIAQITELDTKYGKVPEVRAAVTAAEAKAEKKAVTEKEAKRIKTIAEALVKRDSKLPPAFAEVIAGDPKALMDFVNPKVKTTFKNVNGRVGMYNSETGDLIKDIGAAGDSDVKTLAESVAALAQSMGEKAAENLGAGEGKAAAEQTALIQGKEDALSSIREAQKLLKSKDGEYNIFTGGWASLQKGIAKFGGGIVGNKEKLANTQKYISYIGNTVIPRLKEFGGNDSNQELAFLEGVMGGDTSFEPEALEGILDSAEKKIVAGIKRTQENQKLISQGKPASTKVQGMGQRTTRTLKSGVVVEEEEEK